MPNVEIPLLSPIEGPGTGPDKPSTTYNKVVLRAPKFRDIEVLGEPSAFGRSEGGIMFTSEKDDIVHAYIRRLLIEPVDAALLEQCELPDTLRLREAIFDFFKAARLAAFPTLSTD